MCSARRVQSGKRSGHPAPDIEHAHVGQRQFDRIEALPVRVRGHDVGPGPSFADVVHAAKVWVRGACERTRGGEALVACLRAFGEKREDHGPVEGAVVSEKGHSVATEGTDEPVVVEQLHEPCLGHGG